LNISSHLIARLIIKREQSFWIFFDGLPRAENGIVVHMLTVCPTNTVYSIAILIPSISVRLRAIILLSAFLSRGLCQEPAL
jgi:hypothetical protein